MSTQEESVSPNQQIPRRSWRVQYRLRWFYSKGSYLVLIWILLSTIASGTQFFQFVYYIQSYIGATGNIYFLYLILLPLVLWFVFALLSGWLADSLLGNYKMIKAGAVFSFFSLTLYSMLLILLQSVTNNNSVLLIILSLVFTCLTTAGYVTMLINLLQLGLDQMPDASTDNITSLISWFIWYLMLGS